MSLSHSHILGGERVDEYFKGKASLHKFKIEGQWVSHITLAGNLRSVHAFSYISCQIFEMRACVRTCTRIFEISWQIYQKHSRKLFHLLEEAHFYLNVEFGDDPPQIRAEICHFIQRCWLRENCQVRITTGHINIIVKRWYFRKYPINPHNSCGEWITNTYSK